MNNSKKTTLKNTAKANCGARCQCGTCSCGCGKCKCQCGCTNKEVLKAKRRTKDDQNGSTNLFQNDVSSVVAIAAPKIGVCGTGTLIDVQAHVEVIQAGTIEHSRETVKKNGRKEYDSYSTSNLQKQTTYTVTIVLDDLTYTVQSEQIFGFGFKPTSLVINDPIGACIRGSTLALERPDGKE